MGRSRKQSLDLPLPTPSLVGVILAILVLLQNPTTTVLPLVGFVFIAGLAIYSLQLKKHRQHINKLDAALEKHRHALISEYRRTRFKDSFGVLDESKWQKAREKFLWKVVFPELGPKFVKQHHKIASKFREKVDSFTHKADQHSKRLKMQTLETLESLTPDLYEELCAGTLENDGWIVRNTPRSRDSGADVIAEKSGIRLIIQCKKYSKPVGNKAVQEVNAAIALYYGTHACVVAPNGFTRQARIEAEALNIALLDHEELESYAASLEPSTAHREVTA